MFREDMEQPDFLQIVGEVQPQLENSLAISYRVKYTLTI